MGHLVRRCLVLVLTAMVVAPLHAQVSGRHLAKPTTGVRSYRLQNQSTLRAEVLEVDDGQVKLRVHRGSGTMSDERSLDDFTPNSAYLVMLAVTPNDDVEAMVTLARFAAERELIASARRSLGKARTLAKDATIGADVEVILDQKAAVEQERAFRKELELGKIKTAERILKTLIVRYPKAIDARRAQALRAELDAARGKKDNQRRIAAAADAEARAATAREKALHPMVRRLELAERARRQGMLDSKHFSNAISQFKRASRYCETVLKEADKAERRTQGDSALTRELAAIRAQATKIMTDTLLSSASMYTTRGQYTAAMGNVNRVLLYDPSNRQASAMRGRIEVAASNDGWH